MKETDSNFQSQLIAWRHDLHRHPEFGFQEKRTSNFVAGKLREFGLEVVEGIGKTGVVGVLKKGQSNRSISLRADMDALKIQEENEFEHRSCHQGLMHACGHDGHTVMLLGAARQLAFESDFDGTVYFIFQPAEEHGKGAKAMIEDGLFDKFDIDEIYGLHNMPSLPVGSFAIRSGAIMASESSFQITIKGKGCHAAMPQLGVDAILIASQCVLSLQSIVSRKLSTLEEPAVISITEFITDGTVNVIPSNVILKGDCRCYRSEVAEKIRMSMEKIVAGLCASADANYTFKFNTIFPSTINNKEQTQQAIKAANHVFGEDNVDASCQPYTVSEDFAHMLNEKPGCYGLIGNGGEALHNPKYDFNDDILKTGVQYWVQLVENSLTLACNQLKKV